MAQASQLFPDLARGLLQLAGALDARADVHGLATTVLGPNARYHFEHARRVPSRSRRWRTRESATGAAKILEPWSKPSIPGRSTLIR